MSQRKSLAARDIEKAAILTAAKRELARRAQSGSGPCKWPEEFIELATQIDMAKHTSYALNTDAELERGRRILARGIPFQELSRNDEHIPRHY